MKSSPEYQCQYRGELIIAEEIVCNAAMLDKARLLTFAARALGVHEQGDDETVKT